MAVETQIVREAPEIEAYKIGLLESAKKLADQPITVPIQQVAEMSGLQDQAIAAADPGSGGIGGGTPAAHAPGGADANTGGGGGAGRNSSSPLAGSAGGKGIVVIRYKFQ